LHSEKTASNLSSLSEGQRRRRRRCGVDGGDGGKGGVLVRAWGLGAGGAAGGDRGGFTFPLGGGGLDGIRRGCQSAAISSSAFLCGGSA